MSRYFLRAYVCGRQCVRQWYSLGQEEFKSVYLQRPDDCRYAVVETVQGEFLVWDLYNVLYAPPTDELIEPDPVARYDDLDAAIAATVLLYDDI